MEQVIAASDAAKALAVPVRTVNHWLNVGEMQGEQSLTGRWTTTVGELFRVIEERGFAGKPLEQQVRERLRNDILPKYQDDAGKGGDELSTSVLCLG